MTTGAPAGCSVALKEWATAVRALDAGATVLLIRKGGIREPGKAFRVREQSFLLYPSYEHQRQELLKPRFHPDLAATLRAAPSPETVTFQHWARAHEVLEITDPADLDLLSPHHIWSDQYAQKRLHWKPRQTLAAMLVRVYRLPRPSAMPVLPRYNGCTSWVDLDGEVLLENPEPVLPDAEFLREVDSIRGVLGLPVPA